MQILVLGDPSPPSIGGRTDLNGETRAQLRNRESYHNSCTNREVVPPPIFGNPAAILSQ